MTAKIHMWSMTINKELSPSLIFTKGLKGEMRGIGGEKTDAKHICRVIVQSLIEGPKNGKHEAYA